MAENVTDEQVEQARARVEDLRAQVAWERREQSNEVRSEENALRKARLDAEADKFERELAALRNRPAPEEVAATPAAAPTPTPTARTDEPRDTSARKAESDKE